MLFLGRGNVLDMVHMAYYSAPAAITEDHRLWGLSNGNLFSHSFRGCESKIRVSACLGSGRGPSSCCADSRLPAPLMRPSTRREEARSPSLLLRTLIPSGSPTLMTSSNLIISQRPHPQTPSHWGSGLQHEFGGDTKVQPIMHSHQIS